MLAMIFTLTLQPTLAGGSSGGGGGCGGSSAGVPAQNNAYIAGEVYDDYASAPVNIGSTTYSNTLNGEEYIAQLLGDGGSRFDPRLPGYSYFQGLVQAENHVTIAGQVRVIGGITGADAADATVNFYGGAMVTTNPYAYLGAEDSLVGGPPGLLTRIKTLEEIPNP